VAVSAERVGDEWCFSVTDNGIGIEPRHRERIFGMFKRLHSRSEYSGSGIGLALCKRIIQREGGRLGVEDAPSGQGSRFWFTLPLSSEETS
jgi:signal transduction histidine kinase